MLMCSISRSARPFRSQTRFQVRRLHAWALLACVPVALNSFGCAADGGFGPQRVPAREAYDAGNYRDAYYNALAEQRVAPNARTRSQAGLTAGLAAYAKATESANDNERERWLDSATYALHPLMNDADPTVAGRALAALGLVDALRERHASSADLLSRGARKLSGEDAASAHFHAGLSYELAGSSAAARQSYRAALSMTSDPDLRQSIESRMGSSGYTIQVGAFANRTNAERAGAEATRRAQASGLSLGGHSIVAVPDASGRTLYRVQIGQFATRNEALAARLRFAPEATIMGSGR